MQICWSLNPADLEGFKCWSDGGLHPGWTCPSRAALHRTWLPTWRCHNSTHHLLRWISGTGWLREQSTGREFCHPVQKIQKMTFHLIDLITQFQSSVCAVCKRKKETLNQAGEKQLILMGIIVISSAVGQQRGLHQSTFHHTLAWITAERDDYFKWLSAPLVISWKGKPN